MTDKSYSRVDSPLVSIVTPTYNQAGYISETIESVLRQDYPNIEYIVLDDGSNDNTSEVLKKFEGRIFYERHDNMGQARTLNKGWSLCKGKYIGYLSSDDLLYPHAISRLVNLLEADDTVVCAFPDSDLIDSLSNITKRNVCRPFDLTDTLVRQECYIGPGAIFRKSVFDCLGGWRADLKLAPDREFWIRISSVGEIHMCDEVLAAYREHPESTSYREVSETVGREYLRVLDDYFSGVNIPVDVAARKEEAYGYAYMLLARNNFRAGNILRGMAMYKTACNHHPELEKYQYKLRLIRNTISRPARRILSIFKGLINPRR